MKNKYLEPLLKKAEQTLQNIVQNFGSLNYDQLNWKPNASEWSVGQCLDHLIQTNNQYFNIFEKIKEGKYNENIWERLPVLPNLFGKMILKSVLPETTRKQKTFPVFEPRKSNIRADVVEQFETSHRKMINYIRDCDQLDHSKVVISSPVANYITYYLHHVCKIIIHHEERHFNQAMQVMQMQHFPKG